MWWVDCQLSKIKWALLSIEKNVQIITLVLKQIKEA
jgi:hypothetical protein